MTKKQLKLKLNNYDEGIISDLNNILSKIDVLKKYDENISKFEEQFNSVVVQLQDIDSEIESRLSSDEIDKTRLSFIEERISVLESLKRKYGGSIESVIENRDLMRKELDELSSFVKSDKDLSEKIEGLEKK